MTSDMVQNKYSRDSTKPAFRYTRNISKTVPVDPDLAVDRSFANGTYDLFDVLARHDREKDGLKRIISAAIALLKQAHKTIESTEAKITDQNKRIQTLEKLTTTDALTGLINQRGLFHVLRRELARMQRDEARNTLLVLIDLDNGPAIREVYGSSAHKAALKLIAQILGNEARGMDVAARLRDNEFVLMFPNTTVKETLSRAQHLAGRLNNMSLIWGSDEINITMSIGLKAFGPDDAPESLLPPDAKDTSTM